MAIDMKTQVMLANPYRYGALGSLGNGEYLLIRQENFPLEYDRDVDKYHSADHDRCFQWDYNHARRCFNEHTGTGECGLEQWARSARKDDIIAFLVDLLKADRSVKWTGFRILGTVNRSNGYVVWSLCLFCNLSGTETYSGPMAPNINHPKGLDAGMDEWGTVVYDFPSNSGSSLYRPWRDSKGRFAKAQ